MLATVEVMTRHPYNRWPRNGRRVMMALRANIILGLDGKLSYDRIDNQAYNQNMRGKAK